MVALSPKDTKDFVSSLVGQASSPSIASYNMRDLILYAIGIGCATRRNGSDHACDDELRFLFERHPSFSAFPTYALVLPFKGTSSDVVPYPGPALQLIPRELERLVDLKSALHYDQALEILSPLDPDGASLEIRSEVLGFYRRRKGVLIRTRSTLTDKGGRVVCKMTAGTLAPGIELSRDVGAALPARPARPSGPPDAVRTATVSNGQALTYRLSGDYNPLHADPDIARAAGFPGPILHGLCTLGIAARQVLLQYSPEEPWALKRLYGRFSRPVYPGELLEVKLWAGFPEDPETRASATTAVNDGHGVVSSARGTPPAAAVQEGSSPVTVRFEVCAPERPGGGSPVVLTDGVAVLAMPESLRAPTVKATAAAAMSSQQRSRL